MLQLLPRTPVVKRHDRGEQQVEQAEQGQIDRLGLLQEGCCIGFQTGYERQQQGCYARHQMDDLEHGLAHS
ncbi:hypothetical protein D3C75_1346790 [compost metagenome]